jgi:hypothetical protein
LISSYLVWLALLYCGLVVLDLRSTATWMLSIAQALVGLRDIPDKLLDTTKLALIDRLSINWSLHAAYVRVAAHFRTLQDSLLLLLRPDHTCWLRSIFD